MLSLLNVAKSDMDCLLCGRLWSEQLALQAITASDRESHPTRSCLDISQWVHCEGESGRWPPGQ